MTPLVHILLVTTILYATLASGQKMADVIAIKEGADLDLSCPIVVANEDMIITWTCNNEPANIKSSRIHVTDSGKLRIRSAKVGDSCNYRCEAANGFGTLSVIIKVIIVDKKLVDQLARHKDGNQTTTTTTSSMSAATSIKNTILTKSNSVEPQARGLGSDGAARGGGGGAVSDVDARRDLARADEESTSNSNSKDSNKDDLQIHVEPQQILVEKNKTFSLECRVKHASGMPAPQIIWLKEFIGRKPESLADAHQQDLIAIDNVYYHSLNWPRSFSYSERSACANSALLVRHSNFAHSGRYICFAGYTPAIMASNLSLTLMDKDGGHMPLPTPPQPPLEPNEISQNLNQQQLAKHHQQQQQLRYKMALAVVKVDDPEGERHPRLMHEAPLLYTQQGASLSLISGADGENGNGNRHVHYYYGEPYSWPVTTMVALLITCGLLLSIKLIYVRFAGCAKLGPQATSAGQAAPRAQQQQQQVPHAATSGCNHRPEGTDQLETTTTIGVAQTRCCCGSDQLAVKQIDSSSSVKNNLAIPSTTAARLLPQSNATISSEESPLPAGAFMANLEGRLHSAASHDVARGSKQQGGLYSTTTVGDDEHLYSEISERRTLGASSQQNLDHLIREPPAGGSNTCDLYTIPNRRSLQHIA